MSILKEGECTAKLLVAINLKPEKALTCFETGKGSSDTSTRRLPLCFVFKVGLKDADVQGSPWVGKNGNITRSGRLVVHECSRKTRYHTAAW